MKYVVIKIINIAIDGPSGAGKSSLSQALAEKLGFIYLDTGAFYRSVALYVLENNIDTKNPDALTDSLNKIKIDIKYIDGDQHTFLNGEDVSLKIRTPEVSTIASGVVAKNIDIRKTLVNMQRDLAKNTNVIMDGRDIATLVLPDADVKIFLTASPEERAKRRVAQLNKQGIDEEYNFILEEIKKRDYNDINKPVEAGGLRQVEGSILFDNSDLTKEESLEKLYNIIKEKINDKK